MSSSDKLRRTGSAWRASKRPLHGRKGRHARSLEPRGAEPAREPEERLAAEADIERPAAPHGRKAPTLCGD